MVVLEKGLEDYAALWLSLTMRLVVDDARLERADYRLLVDISDPPIRR